MKKVNIIQHGTDGFGHQLYGLFSCLLLHNVKHYHFDGFSFIKKPFKFEHLTNEQELQCKQYMTEIAQLFIEKFKVETNNKPYGKYIHSHEVYKIPNDFNENFLYGLDNAYYFNRIQLNETERQLHSKNIANIKPLFVNKYLPENRLDKNNIVIHIRMGDALTTGRGQSIYRYNEQICKLLKIFKHKYKNYTYYLHSDGNIDNIIQILKDTNEKFILSKKLTPILNVISDFIHSNIFICGNSGLSKVCSFLGNKELIITNDDNKHSMPDDCIKITDYINYNE